MEFSAPVGVSHGLLLQIPCSSILVSVHGAELHVSKLPFLSRLQTVVLPSAAHHLVCSALPPHLIAAASRQHVTVMSIDDENDANSEAVDSRNNPNLFTIQCDVDMAVDTVGVTSTALLVFHCNRIGVSIFALPIRQIGGNRSSEQPGRGQTANLTAPRSPPVFLPFFASPQRAPSPTTMPGTVAISPCGTYAAFGMKFASAPALQIMALATGTIVAEAVGPAALGGSITEICGIHWLASPQNCIVAWGLPRDGPQAVCLVGVDGDLIQAGMPPTCVETENRACQDGAIPANDGTGHESPLGIAKGVAEGEENPDEAYYFRDLGVRSVAVSPDSCVLAIGGFDGTLRLVNVATWKQIVSWNLDSPCVDERYPPAVYVEREKLVPATLLAEEGEEEEEEEEVNDLLENQALVRNRIASTRKKANRIDKGKASATCASSGKAADGGIAVSRTSFFEVVDGFGRIVVPPPAPWGSVGAAQAMLQHGVGAVQFSADGRWVSARSERLRNVIFVADVARARLASAVVLRDEARCLAWSTQQQDSRRRGPGGETEDGGAANGSGPVSGAQLAIVTGGGCIYFWSERGAAALRIPDGLVRGGAHPRPRQYGRGRPEAAPRREAAGGFRAGRFTWASGDATGLVMDLSRCSSSSSSSSTSSSSSSSFCVVYMG